MPEIILEAARSPLFGLLLTLGVYQLAAMLYHRSGFALLHPVLVSVTVIAALLALSGIPLESYQRGGDLLQLLLGPAVVALALPLYRERKLLAANWLPVLASLLVASMLGIVTAMLPVLLAGGGWMLAITLAPKSATTPIAMAVSAAAGGDAGLTAVSVVLTGVLGAAAGPLFIRWFRLRSKAAAGIALGYAAHGLGTARALDLGQRQGAFAGLGMGLNGLATALLVPLMGALMGYLFSSP